MITEKCIGECLVCHRFVSAVGGIIAHHKNGKTTCMGSDELTSTTMKVQQTWKIGLYNCVKCNRRVQIEPAPAGELEEPVFCTQCDPDYQC